MRSKRLPPFKPYLRQAIRAGWKTMTRRIVKPQDCVEEHEGQLIHVHNHKCPSFCDFACEHRCPYGQVGDRVHLIEPLAKAHDPSIAPFATYVDDGMPVECLEQGRSASYALPVRLEWRWKKRLLSSIYMPTEAARWFGRITEIRVERVQDISEEDAIAEGCMPSPDGGGGYMRPGAVLPLRYPTAHEAFAALWRDINGNDSWDHNQWVWVVRWEGEA